jgi:hypothetical protein
VDLAEKISDRLIDQADRKAFSRLRIAFGRDRGGQYGAQKNCTNSHVVSPSTRLRANTQQQALSPPAKAFATLSQT